MGRIIRLTHQSPRTSRCHKILFHGPLQHNTTDKRGHHPGYGSSYALVGPCQATDGRVAQMSSHSPAQSTFRQYRCSKTGLKERE